MASLDQQEKRVISQIHLKNSCENHHEIIRLPTLRKHYRIKGPIAVPGFSVSDGVQSSGSAH